MSLAITNADAPALEPSAPRSRLHLAARILAWMEARRHHRHQMRQLRAMDAHMLADLGIGRAQAEDLAQQPYAGRALLSSSRKR